MCIFVLGCKSDIFILGCKCTQGINSDVWHYLTLTYSHRVTVVGSFHFFPYLCLLYIQIFIFSPVLQASVFTLVSGLAGRTLSLLICCSHLFDFGGKASYSPLCHVTSAVKQTLP